MCSRWRITCALRIGGDAGELRRAVETEQAAATAVAEMTVAVQAIAAPADCRARMAVPEGGVGPRDLQGGVAILRNDGKNRLQTKLFDDGSEAPPALARDSRAEIVEAEKILHRDWNHWGASIGAARARSFRLQ